jgi:hypothetical protein
MHISKPCSNTTVDLKENLLVMWEFVFLSLYQLLQCYFDYYNQRGISLYERLYKSYQVNFKNQKRKRELFSFKVKNLHLLMSYAPVISSSNSFKYLN